jgi:hypothetical protein
MTVRDEALIPPSHLLAWTMVAWLICSGLWKLLFLFIEWTTAR